MDATRGAKIFTGLAIVLFVGILVRVFYLHGEVDSQPCNKLTAADSANVPAGAGTFLINFFPNRIWLGSPLCVSLAGPTNVAVDKDGKPTLHLFLDGLELKSSVGTLVDRTKNLIQFDVARTSDDAAAWNKIIGQLVWGKSGASVPVHVGVGTDKDGEFNSAAQTPLAPLELRVVDLAAFTLGVAAFLAAVVALYFAAQFSAILRDGDAASSYSLARVQMAFWLYLITAAFVFIWLVTGDYNGVLTSQALTLLGISGTTGLMAISVGSGPAAASTGFWKDILSDGGGVALHRLQIVVWTAILGAVFFAEIYYSFRLPAFDPNLLILLGISGVTYVGFKFNEK
jgi:hypothetical protein